MTEKFKILAQYIKDLSSETPNIETYLFVKDNISKYNLNIDINSKALKEKLIEVNTSLKFSDVAQEKKEIETEYALRLDKAKKSNEKEIKEKKSNSETTKKSAVSSKKVTKQKTIQSKRRAAGCFTSYIRSCPHTT